MDSIFIEETNIIQKILFKSKRIVFYDTNSFTYHSIKQNNRYYALDFFNTDDVIIFTDIVINEINASKEDIVNTRYTQYLQALKEKTENIVILKHTEFEKILSINKSKTLANIEIKNAYSKTFENYEDLRKKIHKINPTTENFTNEISKLYNDDRIRKNKGEISIFLSSLIVANIKKNRNIQIYTDDYAAYPYMRDLVKILEDHKKSPSIGICSTPRNIQILYLKRNLSKKEILTYFKNISKSNVAKLYYKTPEFDTIKRAEFKTDDLVHELFEKSINIKF